MHAPDAPNLLLLLPNWVGDAVMATPALRALRRLMPKAHLTAAIRSSIADLLRPCPWLDHLIALPPVLGPSVFQLRRDRYDTALLFPNSFRSALITRLAGVPRRIGYARDGRSWLLTDRLEPPRDESGGWKPIPAVDYYLDLVRRLGVTDASRRIELATNAEDIAEADLLLERAGLDPAPDAARPLVLLLAGAATKGREKLWPAERFAALADHLIETHDAAVLLGGSPGERSILRAIQAAARRPVHDLAALGCGLRTLKPIAQRCRLAVANDSGGRHIAAAMGTAVISLFGPTDPAWTRLDLEHETLIVAPDGRMDSIAAEVVMDAADRVLRTVPSPARVSNEVV